MCGLYGLMNGAKSRLVSMAVSKMIQDGIVVNSLRGMDSTGVFQRDRKNVTFTHKLAVSGSEFIKDKYTQSFISDADQAVYTVVHNRAATEGKVSEENAHPFEALDEPTMNWTVGVHNGTLTGWKTKARGDEFEVDSEWAINHINVHGDNAFKDFNGAYAMVWNSDSEGGVLKIARNHQRPLYFVYVKDQDRMLFASEYQMLTWIAERNNITLEPNIYEVAPNFIYSFDVENPRNFTRISTPVYSRTDYEKQQRDRYIKEIEGILKPSKKAKKRMLKEAAEREAAAAKAKETTPSVAKAIAETVPFKFCTKEEYELGKRLGVLKTEVSFEPWAYDPETLEWWGAIGTDEDMVTCVMRNVDKITYDTLNRATILTCRIVGAIPPSTGDNKDISYILSRNAVIQDDAEDLGKAIQESIRLHEQDKAREAADNAGSHF